MKIKKLNENTNSDRRTVTVLEWGDMSYVFNTEDECINYALDVINDYLEDVNGNDDVFFTNINDGLEYMKEVVGDNFAYYGEGQYIELYQESEKLKTRKNVKKFNI